MEDKLKVNRIVLDNESSECLENIIAELKSENKPLKYTRSGIVSWIIKQFEESYLKYSKSKMIKDHFDSKTYLMNVLQNIKQSDDALEAVKKAISETKRSRKIKKEQNEGKIILEDFNP